MSSRQDPAWLASFLGLFGAWQHTKKSKEWNCTWRKLSV